MTPPAPGRVLRLAVLAWGLGDLALGHTAAGLAWLAAEALALAAVIGTTILFADTSWYLLPYLVGIGFLVAWAGQAVLAYRRAQHAHGAIPPAAAHSPALVIAWLAVPLLAWATGFWLVAAGAASPDAVVDRFVSAWSDAAGTDGADAFRGMRDPESLSAAANDGLARLRQLCRSGTLAEDCDAAPANLLRDVRVRITALGTSRATAVAELVRFERRPSTVLGFINASELVPVPIEEVLTIQLEAEPAAIGAVRWTIVNAEPG